MSSKRSRKGPIEDTEQREKVTTGARSYDTIQSNHVSSNAAPALANDDPCALTTIFEPSKVKNYLYKVEPTMGRINASSLDLISTTATVLLKTLVEKAVQLEQDGEENDETKNIHQADAKHVLLTSNRLKSVVESAPSPSAFDFLEETYQNFRDKDGSFLSFKRIEYVPRKTQKRKAARQSVADNDKPSVQRAKSGGNDTKRLKGNHAYAGSSLLPSSNCSNTVDPVERAIAKAANATENFTPDKIVEDEDDYD